MNKKLLLSTIALLFAIPWSFLSTSCSGIDDLSNVAESNKLLTLNDSVKNVTETLNRHQALYKVTLHDANMFLKSVQRDNHPKLEVVRNHKDTLMYIVNHDNGWMIIAGDRRFNPIIAESDEGSFSNTSDNENLKAWIDSYADELRVIHENDSIKALAIITRGTSNNETEENEYTKLWAQISPIKKNAKTRSSVEYKWAVVSNTYCDKEYFTEVIPHLIKTKWGQDKPWNSKLPFDLKANTQCPLGCVAVSYGQIVYYMHYFLGKPTGLYHNISVSAKTISGGTTNIGFSRSSYVANSTRWDEMAINNSLQGTTYVGDLLLDIGNRVGMKYSGTGSGANSTASNNLNAYNLSYTVSDYNYDKVKNNLQNSKPVNIRAEIKGEGNAHSWIIDGIATKTRHYVIKKHFEYTENWMNEAEYYNSFDELRAKYNINSEYDYITEDGGTYTTEYLRMNWGVNGSGDEGYFSTYPSSVWQYQSIDKTYNYNYKKRMCYDFK